MTEKLWGLILKIWGQEETPTEWQEAVVISIHKKVEKEYYGNYGGRNLTS